MKRGTFFAFASPSIVIMTALMLIPLLMAIYLGMNRLNFQNVTNPEFIGLANYAAVLADAQFWRAFEFTAIYIVFVVPMVVGLGFVMALILDQVSTFTRGIYLSIFLLPFIIVPIVGSLMFKQLFEASGPLTYLYQEITGNRFRPDEGIVKALIIFYGVWYITPFTLVVYFAGLQTLPGELMEASSIDGAAWHEKIRFIVIPHVRSMTIFILLFTIMDTYRVFDSVFVLSDNLNPIYRANTVMTYTFSQATLVQNLGKANAMAIITVIGILIVLIPNLYISYKEQIAE
ncbi:MAG: carbohydrate ABC transporter permease [Aggregatilineales bacterium]